MVYSVKPCQVLVSLRKPLLVVNFWPQRSQMMPSPVCRRQCSRNDWRVASILPQFWQWYGFGSAQTQNVTLMENTSLSVVSWLLRVDRQGG